MNEITQIAKETNTCFLLHLKFWILNKDSGVIISIHDTTNKVLSSSSNYIVDVVMLPNFG